MGSWGGPTGLPPWLGVIWLSRFLGGRPGLLGGPAVFGFFLENRTEVLLPTSCAGVEDMLGPRPGAEKERRVGEGPAGGRAAVQDPALGRQDHLPQLDRGQDYVGMDWDTNSQRGG